MTDIDTIATTRQKLSAYAVEAMSDQEARNGLDPEIAGILRWMAESAANASDEPASVERVRQDFADRGALWRSDLSESQPREAIALKGGDGTVSATLFPSPTSQKPTPCVIYFHGGGFVIGETEICRGFIERVRVGARTAVLSVDYRLAPEHPFPAAWDDAVASVIDFVGRAEAMGVDTNRLVLAGDSAGAALALATAVALRERGDIVPRGLILINGCFRLDTETETMQRFANGYVLTRDATAWFKDQVLPDPSLASDPRFDLLRADVSGLPPTYQCQAEFDPLLDEQQAMTQRLTAAGVPVESFVWGGMVHGFTLMAPVVARAREATTALCTFIDRIV